MKFQYPLQWPVLKARTPADKRKAGRFSKSSNDLWNSQRPLTLNEACQRLKKDIAAWTRTGRQWRIDPQNVVITAQLQNIRADGMPYSNQKAPKDPAVAVYFSLDGEPMVLAIDSFSHIEQNIAAAAATLEAYRKLDRYGVSLAQGDLIIRLRLPEKSSGSTWYSVLGVPVNADAEAIKSAYHALAKQHHPDVVGGDRDKWDQIQIAYVQALAAIAA